MPGHVKPRMGRGYGEWWELPSRSSFKNTLWLL